MADTAAQFTKTIREEIGALFGVRWDSFLEWIIIAWLSAWFWLQPVAALAQNESPLKSLASDAEGNSGPVSGIGRFIHFVDMPIPDWLSEFVDWLHDPLNNWICIATTVLAVAACVTAVRSYRHTGLRVIALTSTAIACEVNGDLAPVTWILLLSAIPATWACSLDWIDQRRAKSKFSEDSYYFAQGILIKFISRIIFLFAQIPAAPALIIVQLVVSFRTDLSYSPAVELNREIMKVLKTQSERDKARLDALTQRASSAVDSLTGNQSRDAQEILRDYHHALKLRRETMESANRRKEMTKSRTTEIRYREQRDRIQKGQSNHFSE